MRIIFSIFLLLLFICPSNAQQEPVDLPDQRGVVSDYFDEVRPDTEKRINELAAQLKEVTSINLAVAIIRTTRPLDTESYGQALYDKWDVGQKEEGLDHGILLLIAVLDRQVKIIPGTGIDFLFPPRLVEKLEVNLYPLMGRGKIAEAAYMGTASIVEYMLTEWPKYQRGERILDFQQVSKVFFTLVIIAVFLTLIFGGTFVTAFATVAGGFFGFLLLGIPGLITGAAIGFLMNLEKVERRMGQEEKELLALYQEWKLKQDAKKKEAKNREGKS